MTDIKLPTGYEDWVEVQASPARPPKGKHFVIEARYVEPHDMGVFNVPIINTARYFMPPKPKPTLPDVKPGAVISFKSRMGSERVAIRGNFGWRVFENGASVVYVGMNWAEPIATDADLLKDVGDEGFKLMVNPL